MKNSQFVLASRPLGMPSADNFRLEKTVLKELTDGEVLLKSWYISVDPYMRGRMNSTKSYAASFEIDQPIKGAVVAPHRAGVLRQAAGAEPRGDLLRARQFRAAAVAAGGPGR